MFLRDDCSLELPKTFQIDRIPPGNENLCVHHISTLQDPSAMLRRREARAPIVNASNQRSQAHIVFRCCRLAVGRLAVGRLTVGRLAVGRFAVGRLAVGRFAVGRLAVGISPSAFCVSTSRFVVTPAFCLKAARVRGLSSNEAATYVRRLSTVLCTAFCLKAARVRGLSSNEAATYVRRLSTVLCTGLQWSIVEPAPIAKLCLSAAQEDASLWQACQLFAFAMYLGFASHMAIGHVNDTRLFIG
ncbi:hypothetical protein VOLCADRAFT_103381 [Volvox carteri f. nagariensis]|uniref:Uncharacterized protein n=1 Tax=Volvox carteri f. nagariensis TaxID=3068 RepID=D8TLI2_VOLCA|nr:uncharacterized protein VOLCADRAFT_103381 [Volvox carteri f. nagariensis]EFJ51740.1 hypothetical protein VOLCADRAFT_103381 [Volvox carteri f. nagariensis]|eukprot:XP_002947150.1 hypothetical protein VOLCADRAFT_103381 [Volvox carteri f. nagariensis]